ncbi:MAG: hypothetical protein ACKVOE_05740 [Rickettsiales bacterium]
MSELLNIQSKQADTQPATPAHGKRPKTWGEHLFNASTYAGVTWIVNEGISTVFGNAIDPASATKATTGRWNGAFKAAVDWMHTNANPMKWERGTMNRGMRVLWLCMGGNLLVPVVKYLEDHKGQLVRRADLVLENKAGQDEAALERAHVEMDHAPKQSWGSLIKGRLVVMGLALGLGLGAGDDKSPTTKWLAGSRFDKYSNMERFATTVTRDVLSVLPVKEQAVIRQARKASHFVPLSPAEGKAATLLGGTFGFVLVLSGVLSAIFYGSSKFFAARREENAKRAQTIQQLEKAGVIPHHHSLLDATGTDFAHEKTSDAPEKPQTKIRDVVPEPSRVHANEAAASPA